MAVTNTQIIETKFATRRVIIGKSVVTGTTTDSECVTGLSSVDLFIPVTTGSSAIYATVNETFPLASGTVSVITDGNDATYYWMAVGT